MELGSGRLLKGFPNTFIVGEFVIDPGNPYERAGEILKALGGRTPRVLLTHFHADHLTAVPEGAEVYAPWGEEVFVASTKMRLFFTHGVYVPGALHVGRDLPVAGVVRPGERLGDIEVVDLRGHTPGHVGYLVNGVLYAGDALFGEMVLKRYGVPYMIDVDAFYASLDRILQLEPEVVVPGHGPVVGSRKRLVELVEADKNAVNKAVRLVESLLPGDITSIVVRLLKELAAERSWGNVLLTSTIVRAVLTKLAAEGKIEPGEDGAWRPAPRPSRGGHGGA